MKHQIDLLMYPLFESQYYCSYVTLCGHQIEHRDRVTDNPDKVTCKKCLKSKKRSIVEVEWLDKGDE